MWVWIAVGLLAAVLFFVITFCCFSMAFWVPKRVKPTEECTIPPGRVYEPYRDVMTAWMKEARALPHEEVTITSFDGLTLYGKFFEYAKGAPIELMMHGYRGEAERDLCGGVQRAFALGRSVLIVDQRACGKSEGHVITFGLRERYDCAAWAEYLYQRFGDTRKIILTGISMGAATVMLTAGLPLPPTVVGVLADCGYTSAKDIIQKVIRDMHLPATLLYPFVKWGARIYGQLDIEEASPIDVMRTCRLPVIFFHGDDDAFVPCEMSVQNYEACAAEKRLVIVPKAGHGLSYLLDGEGYLNALREFDYGL